MLAKLKKNLRSIFMTRKFAVYALFFVVSQLLYQIGIGAVEQPFFDEEHYVPAARAFITQRTNIIPEHPPLGIALIAASVTLGGDRPFGWRLGSAVSGSLLLLGLLALCFACGMRRARVIYVGLLALCSCFIFIHARIATLDIYLCTLSVWALALVVHALFAARPRHKKILLASSAFLWGAATCIKWIALTGFTICLAYLLLLKAVKSFTFHTATNPRSWHSPRYLQGVDSAVLLLFPPLFFLLGYTLPYLALADRNVLAAIHTVWELQQSVPADHPYLSSMWQWPLMLRPLWYEYLEHGKVVLQAVFCLGNPFLLLLGLGTLGWSLRNWLRHGSMLSFICVTFYSAFFFFWLLIERKVSYHYYYFPSALFLLLSSGECFSTYLGAKKRILAWLVLAVAAAFFMFYYPLISGWRLPLLPYFDIWVWFDAWV